MIANVLSSAFLLALSFLATANYHRLPNRILSRLLIIPLLTLIFISLMALTLISEHEGLRYALLSCTVAVILIMPIQYGKRFLQYCRYKKALGDGENVDWYLTWKQQEKTKRRKRKIRRRPEQPTSMDGFQYEKFLADSLKIQGYRDVKVTPKSGDFGADVIATDKKGNKVCFQCKYYNGLVGIGAVQEIAAARKYYGCSKAAVVTNSKFTKAAKELAEKNDIDLFEEYEAIFY
jgi:HJR/Mrr/RecB family endonuclease